MAGLFFGLSVKEALDASKPDLLDILKEKGVVNYEWFGDDESGVGDYYPVYDPKHEPLVSIALEAREQVRRHAQCLACFTRHGNNVFVTCPTCFFNPRHEKRGR